VTYVVPNSPKRVFLHYLGEHKLSTFHVQRLTLVLFPRSFFRSAGQCCVFLQKCQNWPAERKKNFIPTSEFLYLITNHATGAIKAVVHTVDMKSRKLKNNNVIVRSTNKT